MLRPAWLVVLVVCVVPAVAQESHRSRPNVIVVLADDLGYGELGCYGQERIKTPNLDRIATEGVRFTDFYAGNPVCATSRCVLLTGKHTGHAFIRDNHELGRDVEGQMPLPAGTVTLPGLLQQNGYATACVGKWGLGPAGSEGAPGNHGFDLFFGYLCQKQAHNYYPTHLWRNEQKVVYEGNTPRQRKEAVYACDAMLTETLGWLRARKGRDQPFFLYYASPIPHLALQIPAAELAAYDGAFDDPPYDGKKGYLPHPRPRAAYAAMISRLDREVGEILACLDEIGAASDTLVLFTSDNGATYTGGADTGFFQSNGALSGRKGQLQEGGIRVPTLAWWPGRIAPGRTSGWIGHGMDVMPTVLAAAGVAAPSDLDGISFLPLLTGEGVQPDHTHLYWEFPGYGYQQAVRMGRWKGLRQRMGRGTVPTRLYDLQEDLAETTDVAAAHPEVLARIEELFRTSRTPSKEFPFPALDGVPAGDRDR